MRYTLIYFNDLTSTFTNINEGESFNESVSKVLKRNDKKEDDIKAKFELGPVEMPSEFYFECLTLNENKELVFNNSFILDKHLDSFWIPIRNYLLELLDLEYLKADENDDKDKKSFVIKRKAFLRDLPDFIARTIAKSIDIKFSLIDPFAYLTPSQELNIIKIFNEKISKEQALKITPFYNIIDIKVLDRGSGYAGKPNISVECDSEMVFPPILEIEMENGGVKNVKVISIGCGYRSEPKINVSAPEAAEGRTARLTTEIEYKLDNVNHGLPI